jgi:uracil-DNA glycosylase family 4
MYYQSLETKIDYCIKCLISGVKVNSDYGKMYGFGGGFVMIVGEAPSCTRKDPSHYSLSRDHAKSGGLMLMYKALDAIEWPVEKTYFTNILKCSTPDNRKPTQEEADSCYNQWFLQELYLVNPMAIVALGKYATDYLQSKNLSVPVLSIEHFSYINRDQSKYKEWEFKWRDIRRMVQDEVRKVK